MQFVLMQLHQTAIALSPDPVIVQQECGLVDIFLGLCRFEWQAGYQELATALLQAEIEYCLFCPSLLLTEQGKRRLFEHFWNSSGARVGEDGALGWATWLEKEEEQRQKVTIQESSSQVEEGGWTGWFEPKIKDIAENPESIAENSTADENLEDEDGVRDMEKNDDTEALMKLLGISADAEADGEVKDTTTWFRWSEEELSRESRQWLPVRSESGTFSSIVLYIPPRPFHFQVQVQFIASLHFLVREKYTVLSSTDAWIILIANILIFCSLQMYPRPGYAKKACTGQENIDFSFLGMR